LKPYWGKPTVRNFRGGRGNPKLDRARRAPLPYSAEHLFARRTTTTARLTDDAEAMGNDLDPVLCTVGPATAHRRPYAIPLLGRLFPTDLPSPAGLTFRLSATELLPFQERVLDGSACPAPWQRWLDQVYAHGSATIAARTGLASMYLRTTSRWSPSWMTWDRKRTCQTWPLVPYLRWCRQV
jgi:hypothetical protein